MSLPLDTLREISKYWAGHRLAYTCSALYSSWNPDDHIVTERVEVRTPLLSDVTRITTRRMPNGVYHGTSHAVKNNSTTEPKHIEIIEYDQSRVVSVTYYAQDCNDRRVYYRVTVIIKGRSCQWTNIRHKDADVHDALGYVLVLDESGRSEAATKWVAFADFIKAAHEITARLPESDVQHKPSLSMTWHDLMPGTQSRFFAHLIPASKQEIMSLHLDILCEIGSHWAGRRMHYTCRSLYAQWDPTKYLAIDHQESYGWIVDISHMPNGVVHGICNAVSKPSWQTVETVEYDRGSVVLATTVNGKEYRVQTIINGWRCWWENCSDECDVGSMFMRRGQREIIHSQDGVELRNFVETARKFVTADGASGYGSLAIISPIFWRAVVITTRPRDI